MKELCTEVEIHATPERVWQLLTNFARFPEWNPFIRRINEELKVGARLDTYLQPSGGRGLAIRPVILRVEPNRELSWIGRLALPGVFTGEHAFIIESLGANYVRFVQREVFTGIPVPFLARELDTNTRRGFEEMNLALKALAEQSVQ